jgi:hypothetical protein
MLLQGRSPFSCDCTLSALITASLTPSVIGDRPSHAICLHQSTAWCLPFWTKISCMSGEYSDEWAELRRLRRRVLTVVFAGAAVFVLVPLVSTFASHTAAKVVGLALFAAWVVVLFRFFFVSGEYVYWSCPRCGKPFHYVARWYGRWNNPIARRCVHCGLPKWVDSDPNPKLKRDLDPFRNDSIFKLGE